MKYHDIKTNNMENGDGLRAVIWLSGCDHHCVGCQNTDTWSHDLGELFDSEALHKISDELDKDYISGITITGGDPLSIMNRDYVFNLIHWIHTMYPSKTIWLYTGYTYEELLQFVHFSILDGIDVIVDGEFTESLKDTSLMWRGSPNQRVIDIKKSIISGEVYSHIPLEDQVKNLIYDGTLHFNNMIYPI